MAKETNPRSFVLRVDAATMDALEAWAEDEFRSINGQLQWIIADALRRSGRLKRPRAAAAAGASDPAGQTAAPSEADAPARSAGGKGKAGRAAAAEDESDTRAAIEPKSQVQ